MGSYKNLNERQTCKYRWICLVTTIRNIQVQFHDVVPNAETRMLYIQTELNKTYFLTICLFGKAGDLGKINGSLL